jgi:8-amino-7-oxononanoate synthase
VSGYSPPLRSLERALSDWEGTEAALVFSSGYAANLALVSTLAGQPDAVFSDALNHASLIDGCRLSRAAVHVYRHCDIDHLADLLRKEGRSARRRLIVSDTVFSMDGDLAPLSELVELAERFDCFLLIDEAHATGVLGEHGRGVTDFLAPGSWSPDRVIKMGTLSKALGAQGGFVCGQRRLIAWLVNQARPYIFSTALSPPVAAAARRAVAIVRQEPERRQRVLALSERLRRQLGELGVMVGDSRCQIVPLIVGEAGRAVALSRRLEEHGLLIPAIRPPSVPEGSARLRIGVTAGHTEADLMQLVQALRGESRKAAPLSKQEEQHAPYKEASETPNQAGDDRPASCDERVRGRSVDASRSCGLLASAGRIRAAIGLRARLAGSTIGGGMAFSETSH